MTIRKEIIALLSSGEWTAKDISQATHIPEKEVHSHLEHVGKSLRGTLGIKAPSLPFHHRVENWLVAVSRERQFHARLDAVNH